METAYTFISILMTGVSLAGVVYGGWLCARYCTDFDDQKPA